MASNVRRRLSRYYEHRTNGPNDLANSLGYVDVKDSGPPPDAAEWDHAIHQNFHGYWWDDAALESIEVAEKGKPDCYVQVNAPTRNELDKHLYSDWLEKNPGILDRPTDINTCEPIYTTRPYEAVIKWLDQQEMIVCCAMECTDQKILELIAKCERVEMLVEAKKRLWDKNEKKAIVREIYDEICQESTVDSPKNVYLFETKDDYEFMHCKWMLGRGKKFAERSLILGSFNFTDNAKSNIECALFFPRISYDFSRRLLNDFALLAEHSQTTHWRDYWNEEWMR